MAEDINKANVATESTEPKAAKSKQSKKGKRIVNAGAVHIQASFNNTIISVTDKTGGVLTASSAGANGFRPPAANFPPERRFFKKFDHIGEAALRGRESNDMISSEKITGDFASFTIDQFGIK